MRRSHDLFLVYAILPLLFSLCSKVMSLVSEGKARPTLVYCRLTRQRKQNAVFSLTNLD